MANKQKIIVLYHANCLDGFTSAWVAWKKFGDEAMYVPVKHGEEPPEEVFENDKIIYIIDFSYPEETIRKILKTSEKLIAIDHHISAKESLHLADEHIFDNEQSGASLSWKYFYPDEEMPKLVEYVRNYDLWNFNLPDTDEIIEALYAQDLEFEIWGKIAVDMEQESFLNRLIENGELLIKKRDKVVSKILKYATEVEFGGYKGLAVNSTVYSNEFGHALFEASGTFGAVWSHRGEYINISLRSGEGGSDVSEIAATYGGGGHKHSSGFRLKSDDSFDLNKLIKKQNE